MIASINLGRPMRTAVLRTSAVVQGLTVPAGRSADEFALDLRANACGFGVAEVARIAHDLGFRYGLHSAGSASGSALAPSPGGLEVLSDWWSGGAEPIMSFSAVVISVKRVPADSPVSYGYQYRTSRETTLALVSAGFADGIPRSASGKAQVVLGGGSAVIAGRIAMDQCVADCADIQVTVGDEVTLWGADPTLTQWSSWSGRSEGALLSHVGDRVVKTWQ